jgi:tRNA pseudouridine38-40 synthase
MESEKQIVVLGVAYRGDQYCGFQYQPELETVEKYLRIALEKIACERLVIHCAGRTDKGVHALSQVIHIQTSTRRELDVWVKGANASLPDDIEVLWAQFADENFHARFSAKSRSYIYYLSDQVVHMFERPYVWQVKSLNVEQMNEVAAALTGERNFRAFQSKICQSKSSFRNITNLNIYRENRLVKVDITANAFLHHMVRKMVASFVAVGQGRMSVHDLMKAVESGDRSMIPGQAPAKALFLSDVCYGDLIVVDGLKPFIG